MPGLAAATGGLPGPLTGPVDTWAATMGSLIKGKRS